MDHQKDDKKDRLDLVERVNMKDNSLAGGAFENCERNGVHQV